MALQNQSIKFAFTAKAFYKCLEQYGERLFSIANTIYVVEYTLINLPQLKEVPVCENNFRTEEEFIAGLIYKHWFNLSSPPPFGLNEWKDELKILAKFKELHLDNVVVIFNDLQELSFLNRIYANDELLSISEVEAYLV